MRFTTKLLPSRSGNLGIILLNNPKALHALSLDMMEAFQDVLSAWKQDDSMPAFLLKSNPCKKPIFCAGGDIKTIYQSIVDDGDDGNNTNTVGQGLAGLPSADFFRQEYLVNHALGTNLAKKIQIRYVGQIFYSRLFLFFFTKMFHS